MRKFAVSCAVALGLFLVNSQAFSANNYKIDTAHTFVEFRIKHLGYSWMVGTFDKVDGEFNYDPKTGVKPSISMTIDTTSIDTSHAERDKHLRSPDFLDVAKFPQATFTSTGYEGNDKSGVIYGDLTLHGVTKAVKFPVKVIGEGKDPWGGYRAGFEGELTIDRKDYGVAKPLGPVSWDVNLFFTIEGIKKK